MSGGVCFRLRVCRGWWVFGLERIDELDFDARRWRFRPLATLFFELFLLILLTTSATATATHIPRMETHIHVDAGILGAYY